MRVEAISMGCQDIDHSIEPAVTERSSEKFVPFVDGALTNDFHNRFAFEDF